MVPFDTPYTTFYWSAIVTIAISCTIFELFDLEIRVHSKSFKLVPFESFPIRSNYGRVFSRLLDI